MGMFDYVRVNAPLPDGWAPPDGALQSKDFDCEMSTIEITPDGRLTIERFDREWVPKEERPYPDAPGIFGWRGALRRTNERIVDLDHHGHFNFYGHDDRGRWHEYDAKFTDGNLVAIVPILDTEIAPTETPSGR